MPFVSVVMPAYNAEKTIGASISSVLCQTFQDFEFIIVDDKSIDGTLAIIDDFCSKDSRICVLKNNRNMGASYSRNISIEKAKGEWIAFIDSDDLWDHNKLQRQIDATREHPETPFCYTSTSFIDEVGNKYQYVLHAYPKTTYQTLLKKNLASCSSVFIKASIMKMIKMPGDKMHEDYYCWLSVLKEHEYAYGLDEPLLVYRLSKTSKSANRFGSARMIFNTYRAVGYVRIVSLFLMLRYSLYSISKRNKIMSSLEEENNGSRR